MIYSTILILLNYIFKIPYVGMSVLKLLSTKIRAQIATDMLQHKLIETPEQYVNFITAGRI